MRSIEMNLLSCNFIDGSGDSTKIPSHKGRDFLSHFVHFLRLFNTFVCKFAV